MEEAKARLAEARTQAETNDIRIRYLGKKGEITSVLKQMGKLSPEERKELGKAANIAKSKVENMINEKLEQVRQAEKAAQFKLEKIDVTEPGKNIRIGTKHPLAIVEDEIVRIFQSMGFSVYEGPEVETVFYNFDSLNTPDDHPSRDITDTFYVSDDILLRTQTSPCETRALLTKDIPFKIVVPGRCFRRDTPDATHSPMFHQVEGMLSDQAGSEMTKKIISELQPSNDIRIVRDTLDETAEAVCLITHKGPLPLGNFYDIGDFLELTKKGGSLNMGAESLHTEYIAGDSAYELAKLIYRLPEVVIEAAGKYEPSIVTRHTVDIAQAFNKFYHDEYILVDDEDEKTAKIAMVAAARTAIRNCLALLGMEAPERM